MPRRRECEICGHKGKDVNFHHFYPRPYRRIAGRSRSGDGMYICKDAHDYLHKNYGNRDLAELYSDGDSITDALHPYFEESG